METGEIKNIHLWKKRKLANRNWEGKEIDEGCPHAPGWYLLLLHLVCHHTSCHHNEGITQEHSLKQKGIVPEHNSGVQIWNCVV